ncbi:MAG TPA: ATP-binding cassette domain-containing protein [Mobilitalea sp.]|nr:ATP-binding cassette domain-containing protein [Mobilitalea sp.]
MILGIQDLTKSYGSKKALCGVSLTLTEGIYGLLGPNGAGKSTLINILVNNLIQDEGCITLGQNDIRYMGASYRSILGYMPQQQSLFHGFTARRFLGYMGALKGMDKKHLNARIHEVLDRVNLTNEADKRLGSFSGGMKQRILIAQAILDDPKILILDEPTAGLDPKERIRIRNLISEISFHKIVIIATHVVSDIEFISKEIILLKQGELLAMNSPTALINSMENRVYEITVPEEDLPEVQTTWRISSMSKEDNSILVRILSEQPPQMYPHQSVKPTLEDLYLYLFDDGGVSASDILEKLRESSMEVK